MKEPGHPPTHQVGPLSKDQINLLIVMISCLHTYPVDAQSYSLPDALRSNIACVFGSPLNGLLMEYFRNQSPASMST